MKEEYTKRYIDLADEYLEGVISLPDLEELKQEVGNEPFLKKVIEQHVQARANIRVVGELQLKTMLLDLFEEIPIEKKSSNLWLKVLASVLFVAILVFTFVQNSNRVNYYAEIGPPNFDVMRTDGLANDEPQWTEVVAFFNNKEYHGCLYVIDEITDESFIQGNFGKMQMMKGYCAFKVHDFELALQSLAKITKDNAYYDQSQWYLSVYSYQLKRIENARNYLLEILKDPNHYKYEAAKKMHNQIKD